MFMECLHLLQHGPWRLKKHVLCKVGKNVIFQNKTLLVMLDEPGAINYKKALLVMKFFKGPGANFSGPGAIPKFKKYLFLVFSVPNKDMGLLIVKLASQ